MNDPCRAGNAFPWAEPSGHSLAAVIFDEHVEKALQHEETFLDLVRVRGIALTWLDIHDRQREIPCWDDGGVAMLAGAAGADEAMLRAFVAVNLRVLEGGPVRRLVFESADVFFHDLFERNALKLFGARMPCDAHRTNSVCSPYRPGLFPWRRLNNGPGDGVAQCAFDHDANQCLAVSAARMNIVGGIDRCRRGSSGAVRG